MFKKDVFIWLSEGDAAKQAWIVVGFFLLSRLTKTVSGLFLKLNGISLSIPITDGSREQWPETDGRREKQDEAKAHKRCSAPLGS